MPITNIRKPPIPPVRITRNPRLDRSARGWANGLNKSISTTRALCPQIERNQILKALRDNKGNFTTREFTEWIVKAFPEDTDLILYAIQQRHFSLEWADTAQRTNRTIALACVSKDHRQSRFVAPALLTKEFMLEAICKSGDPLCSYQSFSERLYPILTQQEWLTIIAADARIISNVPAQMVNRAFFLEAAKVSGLILGFNNEFRNDKEIVLAAVSSFGKALMFASDDLKRDREVVLAAVRQDGLAYNYIPKTGAYLRGTLEGWFVQTEWNTDLRNDPEIMLAAVQQNGQAIKDMDFFARLTWSLESESFVVAKYADIISTAVVQDFSLIKDFSPDVAQEVALLPEIGLVGLNIEWYSRFAGQDLREIINNRNNVHSPDGRPLAVLLYAKYDYLQEGGYAFNYNQIHKLIEQGFRVLYYEVANVDELISAVAEATSLQKAKILEIAGHGSKTSIQLSETHYITLAEEERLKDTIGDCMEEDGTAILDACSTASEVGDKKNIATMFRRILYCGRVVAANIPCSIRSFLFLDGGRMFWVEHDEKEATVIL